MVWTSFNSTTLLNHKPSVGFAVAKKLIAETHTIGGRTVQVKTAVPKSNNITHTAAPRMCVHVYLFLHSFIVFIYPMCSFLTCYYCCCFFCFFFRPAGQNRTKLFVGGLHRGVSNREFRAYFESFGKLTDAFIMYVLGVSACFHRSMHV